MDIVLDLDLDFFVSPTERDAMPDGPRLPEELYRVQTNNQVRLFLEKQCGLGSKQKLLGRRLTNHSEAFWTWKHWIESGMLRTPFDVVHVDAHADLGGVGDPKTIKFVVAEMLALEPNKRSNPPRGFGGIHDGNYLVVAVANRWINRLIYVYPPDSELGTGENPEDPGDLLCWWFKDFDCATPILQLPHYRVDDLFECFLRTPPLTPLRLEPSVRFDWVRAANFKTESDFSHMVVAQSPAFTPESADRLLPLVCEYFSDSI
jgi:hypothetical protein